MSTALTKASAASIMSAAASSRVVAAQGTCRVRRTRFGTIPARALV